MIIFKTEYLILGNIIFIGIQINIIIFLILN